MTSVDELYVKYGSPDELGRHFDYILTDIFLSGDSTGMDLVKKLSTKMQKKTIVCSSANPEKFLQLTREASLNCRFLHKPLHPVRTVRTLKNMCGTETSENTRRPLRRSSSVGGPVVLITGCSSGVGEALADLLSKKTNYKLVLTARDRSVAKVRARFPENDRLMVVPLDVGDPEQIVRTVSHVIARWGRLDILINNAGICYRATVEHMDQLSEIEQLKVNYIGPMMLSRAVIPLMRERGRGKIINVSSVSGILGMPTMASYSASKHALEAASESMWYELKPMGINVSVIRPGFIKSDGYSHVLLAPKSRLSTELDGPYADFYHFMTPFVSRMMNKSLGTPQSVAEKVFKVIRTQNPPLWVDATPDALMFSCLRHLLPDQIFNRLINLVFRLQIRWGKSYSRADPRRLRS
ncbi:SDR family oxidoreductase [Bdellovibrio sp. HCB337]|uniref:SDR family oxidoreductase n=1 Tax=Bdellovibrio sp. HCB337 TaxID=3394358 RepID=UPI0039A6F3D5